LKLLKNVLSNAIDALEIYIKHTAESPKENPKSGKITISTTVGVMNDNEKSAVIQIRDNGPGMPETIRQRIFDPFFTTKPIGKGTGLGLSISYQIVVEKHGGIFKCDSQPDVGTEFWIEIPIKHISSGNREQGIGNR
jgi:signal transduction histidine kinase